ncbi:MAG: hypothetical protein HWN69_09100, partial [Desulfobacterales bacterium]|nr:hypothetical protein [Desulfobacterales bacterium]
MQKRISFTIVISLFLLIAMFPGRTIAQPPIFEKGLSKKPEARHVSGEVIVKFKPGVSDEVVREINRKHGTSVLSTSRFAGFKRLRIPKGRTVEQMVEIYSRNPNVEYSEPNFIAHAFWVPDDEFYGYQWHLDNSVYG